MLIILISKFFQISRNSIFNNNNTHTYVPLNSITSESHWSSHVAIINKKIAITITVSSLTSTIETKTEGSRVPTEERRKNKEGLESEWLIGHAFAWLRYSRRGPFLLASTPGTRVEFTACNHGTAVSDRMGRNEGVEKGNFERKNARISKEKKYLDVP